MGTKVELGYTLSSEERQPEELVRLAQTAEESGFTYALMSDHFHPWTDRQGSSPFVWSVLGGIAATTQRLRVGTGVTCPIIRIHPAIIAQASATIGCLMPGRFFLGVGSGESLNEHVTGQGWPPPDMRQDMLEEAVEILRTLHRGGEKSHHGKFFQVHDARVYNLPEEPIPIYIAAAGQQSARRKRGGVRRRRRRGEASVRPAHRLLGEVQGRRCAHRTRLLADLRIERPVQERAAPAGPSRRGRGRGD